MNKLNPWFVSGFAEGEGAFTYVCGGTPVFSLRQRFDYGDLVYSVAQFFKVGSVYECKAIGRSRASTYYRVSRLHELTTIIRHFDRYPLQSQRKRSAYEAWKELVAFKRQGRKAVSLGKLRQIELTAKLTQCNCRSRPRVHRRPKL